MDDEANRCWCGSMLKDKPHNCIGTRGRVEGLLKENVRLQGLMQHNYEVAQQAMKDLDTSYVGRDKLQAELELLKSAIFADIDNERLRDQVKQLNLQIDVISKLCRDDKDGCKGGLLECAMGECWPCAVMKLIEKRKEGP